MPSRTLYGIPVSAGVAIGKAYCLNRNHFSGMARQTLGEEDVPREMERLGRAFEAALQDLERILSLVPEDLKEHAAIVIVQGANPEKETIERATREGIPILVSDLPEFQLVGRIYQLIGNG